VCIHGWYQARYCIPGVCYIELLADHMTSVGSKSSSMLTNRSST